MVSSLLASPSRVARAPHTPSPPRCRRRREGRYILGCDGTDSPFPDGGCNGGWLDSVWRFIASAGLPTEGCVPYTSADGQVGACPAPLQTAPDCKDGSAPALHRTAPGAAGAAYSPGPRDVGAMQADIALRGPIQAGIFLFDDISSYTSGVYTRTSVYSTGGHAVQVIGWGTDASSGLDYWLVQNRSSGSMPFGYH
jgi:hypothetical protein